MLASGTARGYFWMAAAVIGSIYGTCVPGYCQTTVTPREINEKIDLLKSKAYTRCGDSYYSGPFERPILSCLDLSRNQYGIKSCQMFTEARKVGSPPFVPKEGPPATTAEQMNGLEWRGFIMFNYAVYRTRYLEDGMWYGWSSWADGRQPAIVAQLWKQNRQWYIRDLRDAGSLTGAGNLITQQVFGNDVTLDTFVRDLRPLSCDDIGNSNPHKQIAVSELRPPRFNGTVDEFAAAFPEYLERAAMARGLDPRNYDRESKFTIDTIRTCTAITPQMARSVTNRYHVTDLSRLGEQYRVCTYPTIYPSALIRPEDLQKMDLQLEILPNWPADNLDRTSPLEFTVKINFTAGPRGSRVSNPTSIIVDVIIE
jgi:hypothetical protein